MNYIEEEIIEIVGSINYYESLKNKVFLITGATGLIGSYVIRTLIKLNTEYNLNIKVYGVARSKEKAEKIDFFYNIDWIFASLTDKINFNFKVDYVIHAASPTDSKYFVTNPVEVIEDTNFGLDILLKQLSKINITRFVLISSLEVYGMCNTDKFLCENEFYSINPTNVRNCYSLGKKMLECLACSYSKEYKIPISIVRLGQTFGPGVKYTDNRVFAQFARCVTEEKNIVLLTKGETKRSYCSLIDAVNGILLVLLRGENCEAYNLASDNSYMSIIEMAKLFIENTNSKIEICETTTNIYLGTIKFGLNTNKIKDLGFKSYEGLDVMVKKLKKYFKVINTF